MINKTIECFFCDAELVISGETEEQLVEVAKKRDWVYDITDPDEPVVACPDCEDDYLAMKEPDEDDDD